MATAEEPTFQGRARKKPRSETPVDPGTSQGASVSKASKCPCSAPHRHSLDDCWALHESKRPKGWRGGRAIAALQKAREQDNKVNQACEESLRRVGKGKGFTAPSVITPNDEKDEVIETAHLSLELALVADAGHPLSSSFIVDTGATAHICNSANRFTNLVKKNNLGYLLAGRDIIPLEETGNIKLRLDSFNSAILKSGSLILQAARHVPSFPINLVSLELLRPHGYYLNTDYPALIWKHPEGGHHIAIRLRRLHKLYVIEYNALSNCGMLNIITEPSNSITPMQRKHADHLDNREKPRFQ